MSTNPFEHLPAHGTVPRTWPATAFNAAGVKALFYKNVPYHGKETRCFAWLGFPEGASEKTPVPAVVLVHGGGATALADWVRLWNQKGYAAIAMDNCGKTPCWSENPYYSQNWPTHRHSGPAGWSEAMLKGDDAPEDQWPFHAVASIEGAFELLAANHKVDASRIGITGISWGAYLTCLAASLDERFAFAIPVYGCGGFDSDDSSLSREIPVEQRKRWFSLWDPDTFLPQAVVPFLWLTDAEDQPYPLDAWRKSAELTVHPLARQSLRTTDFPHGHTQCWTCRTIFNYADAVLKNRPLPRLSLPERSGKTASCQFTPGYAQASSFTLKYTCAAGKRWDAIWRTSMARQEQDIISAELPYGVHSFFFQATDAEGGLWTSPVVDLTL